MTAATIGVERSRRRRFHLHCSCGSTVATSEKTAICTDCGQFIAFRRRRRWRYASELRTVGQDLLLISGCALILILVFCLFDPGWVIMLAMMVLAAAGSRHNFAPRPTWHRHATPDYSRQFRCLGWLILTFVVLVTFSPTLRLDAIRERIAILSTPQPPDCYWSSRPIGDKRCHYESSISRVTDSKGEHLVVEWRRIEE
jgi:hypothetical protein